MNKINPDLEMTKKIGYKILLSILTLVIGFNFFGWVCQKFHVKQDGPVEEICEEVIGRYFNMSPPDLTPNSPEDTKESDENGYAPYEAVIEFVDSF